MYGSVIIVIHVLTYTLKKKNPNRSKMQLIASVYITYLGTIFMSYFKADKKSFKHTCQSTHNVLIYFSNGHVLIKCISTLFSNVNNCFG